MKKIIFTMFMFLMLLGFSVFSIPKAQASKSNMNMYNACGKASNMNNACGKKKKKNVNNACGKASSMNNACGK